MSKQIVTPEAILSYPHIWEPDAFEPGDVPKYSAALIFTKDTDIEALQKAVLAVAKEKFGKKAAGLIRSGKLGLPFRDDPEDIEEKGYPEGSTFFNARSKNKPGVVSIFNDGNGKPSIITDEDEIYPGVIVKAALSVFYYKVKGNAGIAFGLNHIQKIRDGERIDGRVSVEDSFDVDPDAGVSLSDLEDVDVEPDEEDGDDGLDDLLG